MCHHLSLQDETDSEIHERYLGLHHLPSLLITLCWVRCRLIAATERIDVAYIQRRCGGMLGEAAADARHARFAAAMLLDLVVRDASCVLEVENAWGKRDSLTKMGEWH